MKIVAYLDTDKLFTRNSEIYALSSRVDPFTMEQLIRKYLQVLSEGVGWLESECHIRLDEQVDPVQHAPG